AGALGSELRAHLKRTLPEYMVPGAWVVLEAFPLTPNGKIDRRALPEPQADSGGGSAATSQAFTDALEEIIAGTWASVLGQQQVGRHANFFELGGHSLLATQVSSRLSGSLQRSVPVRWLFEAPTVAELASRIRDSEDDTPLSIPPNRLIAGQDRITPEHLPLVSLTQAQIDHIVDTVEGGAANIQDIYPLAPLQEGILFHHLAQSEGDTYLLQALFELDSEARCLAFIDALQQVINRHDSLRTAVVWEHLPEPVQVVWRHARVPIERLSLNPAQGPIEAQLLAHGNPRHVRLDLTQAPLLRISLAQDGERWLLLLLNHHLTSDHSTLEVIGKEIDAFWHQRAEQLAEPISYRNFVLQARRHPPGEHEAFFRQMLGSVDTPTHPYGLSDVQLDAGATQEATQMLSTELAQRVRHQVRRHSVTPAALCHLAWALVLQRLVGQDTLVFGTVLLGRMQGGAGVENTSGLFINTLPVRIDCDARAVHDALQGTQRTLLALIKHEHAPLVLAQRCSAVAAQTPLFSSLLNYRHSQASSGQGDMLEGVRLLHAQERTNYPLNLAVDDLGQGFSLTAQGITPIDPERICAYMQQAIDALVSALERAPGTPINQLDILPKQERQQLLVEWNQTEAPIPQACVHRLFEQQVAKTPQATAVVFEEQRLSYAELNARANQLAHWLRAQHVGADHR
ncbi:MAG: condensation domain-containing protein, partial [bacterium]